jgi:predicted amidophosphoribosyltransferase
MGYQPKNLNCHDCEQFFPFSTEEQRLCAELGYEQPRRCPSCRRSLERSRRLFPTLSVTV